jgi:RHS repeat-associated protein
VLRRSRANQGCLSFNCFSVLQRYIYDGDEVLYETSYPGWDTVGVATLEADTLQVTPDARFYGSVVYLNGPIQDRPLDVIRYNLAWTYSQGYHAWGPQTLIPHYNWQDAPDFLSFQNGVQNRCITGANPPECFPYRLPDNANAFLRNGTWPVASWLGTTLAGVTEAQGSGFQYKRNRFYDPVTGRFSQEDPIGLAGGFNAYGFAQGDPVSYRDANGTCPICLAIAVGAGIGLAEYGVTTYLRHGKFTWKGALIATGVGAVSGAAGFGIMKGLSLAADALAGSGAAAGADAAGGAAATDAAGSAATDAATSSTSDGAANIVTENANKFGHIFDQAKHGLEPLVEDFGGRQQAFNAIYKAFAQRIAAQGSYVTGSEITVQVGSYNVTVTGTVVKGIARIGTFFIKQLPNLPPGAIQ